MRSNGSVVTARRLAAAVAVAVATLARGPGNLLGQTSGEDATGTARGMAEYFSVKYRFGVDIHDQLSYNVFSV